MNNEAFVYCWKDKLTNKLYIGYHKGDQNDGYVCSSKVMLVEYNKRPQDFIRSIIATGSKKDMIELETIILQVWNAASNSEFYNLHNNTGRNFSLKGNKNPMWGRRGNLSPHNGKKNYYDPITKITKRFLPDTEPDGWIKGSIKKRIKGTKWFHNPITKENQYFIPGSEPEGWINGMFYSQKKKTVNGRKWYYNPLTDVSKYLDEGAELEGWIRGRKKNVMSTEERLKRSERMEGNSFGFIKGYTPWNKGLKE